MPTSPSSSQEENPSKHSPTTAPDSSSHPLPAATQPKQEGTRETMLFVDRIAGANPGTRLAPSRSGGLASQFVTPTLTQKSGGASRFSSIGVSSHVVGKPDDIMSKTNRTHETLMERAGKEHLRTSLPCAAEFFSRRETESDELNEHLATKASTSHPSPHETSLVSDETARRKIIDHSHSIVTGTSSGDRTNSEAGKATTETHLSKNIYSTEQVLPRQEFSTPIAMSVDKLTPPKKPRRRRTPPVKPGQSTGRWTKEEHQAFLEGLRECGREWKKVAMRIPTRTSAQIRSHAQKYFAKMQRDHDTDAFPDAASPQAGLHGFHGSTAPGLLGPSVQQNVERIIANPQGVQREVENTLEALRERYRQLQRRLEQRQRRRHLRRTDGQPRHPIDNEDGAPPQSPMNTAQKRPLETIPLLSPTNDDQTSVTSSMGNDELIALQVLGGSLPRGDSAQDLQHLRSQNSLSSASSAASSHRDEQILPSEPLSPDSAKRQKTS